MEKALLLLKGYDGIRTGYDGMLTGYDEIEGIIKYRICWNRGHDGMCTGYSGILAGYGVSWNTNGL